MSISALTHQLCILFSIILLGFFASRLGLLPKNTNSLLSALVLNIANPCAVFASVLGGQRTLENRQVLILLAVAFGLQSFLVLIAHFVPKLLRLSPEESPVYRFMVVFGNVGFLGFPLISALFGPEALFLAAIFVMMFQLFCFTYGVALFEGSRAKFQLRSLCTPMLMASVLSLLFYLSGVTAPKMVWEIFDTLGGLTSPAAMLAIGCALSAQPLNQVFTQPKIYGFSVLRLLGIPLAVYGLCFWWMKDPLMLGVTVAVSAMPAAANTCLFANRYGGREDLAASGVFVSTLLSLFTLPFVLWLLF